MRKTDLRKIAFVLLLSVGCVLLASCKKIDFHAHRRVQDANGVWEAQYILNSKTECALGDFYSKYKKEHDYPPYIFVPSHITNLIDGRKVKVVEWGYQSGMLGHHEYYACNTRIYMPYTMKLLQFGKTNEYMLPVPCSNIDIRLIGGDFYVPKLYFDGYKEYVHKDFLHVANVVYDINYYNEEFKYYYVDDCEYGGIIEAIPPIPEREGYSFDGWYKEPNCVNMWSFEKDTLPNKLLDEEGKEVFQETALYAKWNKK